MHLGIHARLTAESLDVRALARRVEELGFESLFVPEHTHIPASFVVEQPDRAEWADWAARLYDPWIALAAAASVTTRLRVGTGICLVPQHHPITLAKQVATLDRLSQGRFLFGVGAGWVEGELRHHGVPLNRRFRVLSESLEAMRVIWDGEETYSGREISFAGVRQGPKPTQRPQPPILVGGEGEKAVEIARAVGGEWFPHAGANLSRGAGLRISIFGAEPDPDALARYRAQGVERCVLILPSTLQGEADQALERLTGLVAS